MFDSIRIGGGDSFHRHEITEKRAPTDESVKLLREMEAAAEKNVLCRGKLENNVVSDIRWVIAHEPHEDRITGRARFSINGREFLIDVPISCTMSVRLMGPPREFLKAVHQRVIEKIAEQVIMVFIDKEAKNLLKH